MELKTPKAKKKNDKLKVWGKMLKTPLFILFLLGTTCGDNYDYAEDKTISEISSQNLFFKDHRHRHLRTMPVNASEHRQERKVLSDIKYLRRHLNKAIVNFVMTDTLVDGEVENRLHFNGITAKETTVAADSKGLKLRQLTDGRHLIQIIYGLNGDIQDCELLTNGKESRNFLKTLRKELKLALDEENFRLTQNSESSREEEKYSRHFENVTFRILRNGEDLPRDIAQWMNYDRLKMECLKRHEELKYMVEHNNKVGEQSLDRSRRSLREHFILPGTKWCGAGQLAEKYNELGSERNEDRCCRSHDNCRVNIGAFKRRFGYFNLRPFTISHCRCDRRFRACLKLADTSVSNMVGKMFFNVVQTKCFVLKPRKMCTQRSWWGKCLQRGYRKQAYLRDNLPY